MCDDHRLMMDSQSFDRVAEVFEGARGLASELRAPYLDDACAGDEPLRSEVESLLAEYERADQELEPAAPADALRGWASETADALADGGLPAIEVPGFRILALIGEGGQGAVYEAEQRQPRRIVALKLLRPQLGGSDVERRFEREAQVLARLQHPGIATILGSGVVDSAYGPLPYFAMELISGRTLVASCEERRLDVPERVALLAEVCDAVAHAHAKGVVHRDLKPSNIVVDQEGRARVLDFGIARVLDMDVDQSVLETRTGQVMGTLAYMSPEQASGRPADVDEQTDVFALGVLAFELFTGELPRELVGLPIAEQLRLLADGETTLLGSVDGSLRGDLETIVAKAMAQEKSRRYSSAIALAGDLRRFLRSEPILARRSTALYQLSRFVQRNRALSASFAALLLALVAGTVISLSLYLQSRTNEDEARWQSYVANLTATGAQLTAGTGGVSSFLESCPEEYKGTWEWLHLRRSADESLGAHIVSNGIVHQIALGPDGLLASAGGRELPGNYGARDYRVRVWDFDASSHELRPVRDLGTHRNAVRGLAFRPGGDELVSLSRAHDDSVPGEVHLWRASDGAQLASLDGGALGVSPTAVAWLPKDAVESGSLGIAVACLDGVQLWEPEAERLTPLAAVAGVNVLAVSDAGASTHLLTGQGNGSLGVWDLGPAGGAELRRSVDLQPYVDPDAEGYRAGVSALAASPTDGRVLAGLEGGALALVDVGSGQIESLLDGHTRTITSLVWSEDGRFAWSTSLDKTLRWWEFEYAADGGLLGAENVQVLHGHAGYVTSLVKLLDPPLLITGAYDRTLRVWDNRNRAPVLRANEGVRTGTLYSLAFDQAGDSLAWRPDRHHLAVVDVETGATRYALPRLVVDDPTYPEPYRGLILGVSFHPGGEALYAVHANGGRLRRFSARTGELEATLGPELPQMLFVDFSNDGTRYAACVAADGEWRIQIRSLATGELEPDGSWPIDAASQIVSFTPDDSHLLHAVERSIVVRELPSGDTRRTLELPHEVNLLACSPDGRHVAATTYDPYDRALYLFDLTTGESRRFEGSVRPYSLAFMPDGSRIVTGNRDDGTVSLWDVERGITLTLTDLEGTIQWVAVSPDGTRIAAVDSAGHHRVWDARPLDGRGVEAAAR